MAPLFIIMIQVKKLDIVNLRLVVYVFTTKTMVIKQDTATQHSLAAMFTMTVQTNKLDEAILPHEAVIYILMITKYKSLHR